MPKSMMQEEMSPLGPAIKPETQEKMDEANREGAARTSKFEEGEHLPDGSVLEKRDGMPVIKVRSFRGLPDRDYTVFSMAGVREGDTVQLPPGRVVIRDEVPRGVTLKGTLTVPAATEAGYGVAKGPWAEITQKVKGDKWDEFIVRLPAGSVPTVSDALLAHSREQADTIVALRAELREFEAQNQKLRSENKAQAHALREHGAIPVPWGLESDQPRPGMNRTATQVRQEMELIARLKRNMQNDMLSFKGVPLKFDESFPTPEELRRMSTDPGHMEYRALKPMGDLRGPKPDADGWIAWAGGERPVAEGSLVSVRLRCGESLERVGASFMSWGELERHRDREIVAYRVEC